VIQFDHIAIAARRIADAPPYLMGVLGGVPFFGMSADVFRFGQWEFDGGGRIEVLEPRGDNGFLHRFLAARGPGVHHVTFKVPNLAEARERATALGYTVVGYNASVPRWKEAFLHPKEALGLVVQIVESPDEPPRGHWRKPPPMPPDPPPAVRLLGLRLSAHSAERARRQWTTLLGADASVEGGRHVFRWRGSPLQIAVDVASTGDEGPVAIEIARPSRAVTGLGAPAPDLGVVFVEGERRHDAPGTGHPRNEPDARHPLQCSHDAPGAGHPRNEPDARHPLQ
jgi:methylmalonyl-CoA/ethylmalonyl-CoA epimerase